MGEIETYKVIMLPIDKPNDTHWLWKDVDDSLYCRVHKEYKKEKPQHLYLIGGEIKIDMSNIKIGEHYLEKTQINPDRYSIFKRDLEDVSIENSYKIIATTDTSLTKCDYCNGTGIIKDVLKNPSCHYDPFDEAIFEDEPCEDCEQIAHFSTEFIKQYAEQGGIDEVCLDIDTMEHCRNCGVYVVDCDNEIDCEDSYYTTKIFKTNDKNEVLISNVEKSYSREEVQTLMVNFSYKHLKDLALDLALEEIKKI